MEREALRVVQINADHTYTLNEKGLANILMHENVKDRKVAVISVAGATRKGKSFILDFFIRYMRCKYVSNDTSNWLGDPDKPLSGGFSWRGGSEKNTSGILIWPEVFFYDSPAGDKIAIILMDTQGVFDNESTVKDNTVIFALSTMVSSVQIFNVQNNIQEDDLQHLQLFTEYGKLALQETGIVPFQKLLFLVRDWSNAYEYDFGLEGGKKFLDRKLKVTNEQADELKSIRQHIQSCFERMECYLMPHPGFEAAENPKFSGKLTEIRPLFTEQLKDFVPTILSPENLVLKTIGGRQIRGREFYTFFEEYMSYFNSDKIPNPESLLATTAKANNLAAIGMATELYNKQMSSLTQKLSKIEELDDIHNQYKQQSIEKFNSEAKIGGEEFAQKYRQQLCDTLERLYAPIRIAAIKQLAQTGCIDPPTLNILEIIGIALENAFHNVCRTVAKWFGW